MSVADGTAAAFEYIDDDIADDEADRKRMKKAKQNEAKAKNDYTDSAARGYSPRRDNDSYCTDRSNNREQHLAAKNGQYYPVLIRYTGGIEKKTMQTPPRPGVKRPLAFLSPTPPNSPKTKEEWYGYILHVSPLLRGPTGTLFKFKAVMKMWRRSQVITWIFTEIYKVMQSPANQSR